MVVAEELKATDGYEEGYRRGTILGLTIAEVFILLVFLMLLALMGLNSYWDTKHRRWDEIIEQYTPEEIKDALAHPDSLRIVVKALKEQIERLRTERNRLQRRVRILEGREGLTGAVLDSTKAELEEVTHTFEESKRSLVDAKRQIRIFGKGITPPCWYQRIEESNPITQANWREKPYYLFDIAIREDHMEVQRLPIPDGSAEDDNGASYADEAEELQLDTIPYGVRLTDTEMRNVMRPLYEKGKGSQMRSYSCIFYVRVWDETPPASKERWKQAHDGVLEQLFGTHQVRGTSWRDRDKEPVNVRVEPTWQGLKIAPEDRCSEFDRERDYPHSQSLERQIQENVRAIRCGYTGRVYDTLAETEIEHIVALSEAHDSGLCGADVETRRQFSNDLLNLTLADPVVNREKSDKAPGEWLPVTNRLWYAQRVIAVKHKYGLTIDRKEHGALASVLVDLETALQPGTQDASDDSVGQE